MLRSNAVITAENKPREAAIQLDGAFAKATICMAMGATGGVALLIIAGGAAILGGMAGDAGGQYAARNLWDSIF